VNYELVLGMKVKSCINPQRWGVRIDLDFPRIYVWDCNDIKGLNVTKARYFDVITRVYPYAKRELTTCHLSSDIRVLTLLCTKMD